MNEKGIEEIEIVRGSGNVFKDLGFENPDLELMRAKLSLEIFKILEKRKLIQAEARKVLGIAQSDVSKLMNGNFERFGIERLIKFLNRLDRDIKVSITKHSSRSKKPAGVCVTAA